MTDHFAFPPAIKRHTAIIAAAENNAFERLDELLEDATLETHAKDLHSLGIALHEAVLSENYNMAEFLITAGAPVNHPDEHGWRALDFASYNTFVEIAQSLLDAGGASNMNAAFVAPIGNQSDPKVKAVHDLFSRHKQLPKWDGSKPLCKEDLFEQKESGFCLLDSANTWHRLPEVLGALAENGEQLTLADLQRTNVEATPFIVRAAECRAFEPLMKHLAEQGVPIQDELLVEGKELSPLGKTLLRTWNLPLMFTKDNWRDATMESFQKVVEALPESADQQVKNLHSLSIVIGAPQQQPNSRSR